MPYRPRASSADHVMLHAMMEAGLDARPCSIWTSIGWRTFIPPPSIRCPVCGARSFNRDGVEHRYCGRCHRYHDGRERTVQR